MKKDYNGVTLIYNSKYDSYCKWNGNAFVNDGKVAGALFYGTEKAKNWDFIAVNPDNHNVKDRKFN